MMTDLINYTGMRFHSWVVLRFDSFRYATRSKFWLCRCDCGTERAQQINVIRSGKSKSCGHAPMIVHGMARNGYRAPEYRAWEQLKQRCLNCNDISYARYGGRGISVCQFISEQPASIKLLIGRRPSPAMSIDRKCNDGHYSCGGCPECVRRKWPMNIRWATKKQQANNRRNSVSTEINGITETVSNISQATGLSASSIHRRLKKGCKGSDLLLPRQHRGGRPRIRR